MLSAERGSDCQAKNLNLKLDRFVRCRTCARVLFVANHKKHILLE